MPGSCIAGRTLANVYILNIVIVFIEKANSHRLAAFGLVVVYPEVLWALACRRQAGDVDRIL